MKIWQKWIAIVLVMALPVTGFAGLSFEPHCDSHSQNISISDDHNSAEHCLESGDVSHHETQTSQSDDCQCECNNHIACINAGTVAITGFVKTSVANCGDHLIHYISNRVVSLHLSAIFRPPILS